MTPKRETMRLRVVSSADQTSSSAKCTFPLIGGSRPIMFFMSVLLPDPEPPRIPNTSPLNTSKLMLVRIGFPSYPVSRSRTRMMGSPLMGVAGATSLRSTRSDVEEVVGKREEAVDDDEQDDARNDGAGRRLADGRSAGLRLQPAQAADAG